MSYRELQRMDAEEYSARLEEYLYSVVEQPSDDFWFLRQSEGHSAMHFAQSEAEIFTRLMREKVPAATCFNSPEAAKDYIANALIFQSAAISDWFFSEQSEFKDERDFRRISLTLNMGGSEYVGYGMDKQLNVVETRALTVILDRDFRPDSTFGLSIVTAYPDIIHLPQCNKIDRTEDIRDLILRDGYCKNEVDQLYCLLKYERPELPGYYFEPNGIPTYSLKFRNDPDRHYEFYFSQTGQKMYERFPGERNVISTSQLGVSNPELFRVVSDILNARSSILQRNAERDEKQPKNYYPGD